MQGALAALTGTDPATGAPYEDGYAGLAAEIEGLERRLGKDGEEAHEVAPYINSAIEEMHRVSNEMGRLIDRASTRSTKARTRSPTGPANWPPRRAALGEGIERLSAGTTSLVAGLGRLSGGAEALEQNLAAGAVEDGAAGKRARRSERARCSKARRRSATRRAKCRKQTPGLFNSGYFVLSALDGAPPGPREKAGATIDLEPRRPGGLDAGDLEVRIQLAGLDPAEQGTGGRGGRTGREREPRRPASRAAPRS